MCVACDRAHVDVGSVKSTLHVDVSSISPGSPAVSDPPVSNTVQLSVSDNVDGVVDAGATGAGVDSGLGKGLLV